MTEPQHELVAYNEALQKDQEWLLSDKMQSQLQLALPRHVDALRMARLFLTEERRIKNLVHCTWESKAGALIECAQLGLDIGTRGH